MFAGKQIVITGAARGIGRSLAEKFLNDKATVWALDYDGNTLAEFSDQASKYGKELHPIKVDLTDRAAFEASFKSIVEKAKRIDYWINNAGISGLGDFSSKSFEDFENVIRINLNATVLGTRLALEHMEEQGRGTIVNMASVAGHLPCPYLSAYCASKYAVVGFSQALREELYLKHVPVKMCIISPGFVDTKMLEREKAHGFPEWLGFLLSTPEAVSEEIYSGLKRGKLDIYPTFNGRMMLRMGKMLPQLTTKSSRLLLSKSVKDLLFFRKLPPTR